MIASYLGLVLGLILVMHPQLGLELLMLVALFCPVPGAGGHDPAHPPGAVASGPMEPRFFIKRVPQSLIRCWGQG
jgi:hypothetical protein